jgi:indole-3-pyruvate monooxygenase
MLMEYMKDSSIHTLVIGASISGLSCAASLKKQHIEYLIIEKQHCVAAPWHHHYERLHLHTSKRFSSLPYKKFGKTIPRYPARQQIIDYLDDYQRAFQIKPVFNTEALSVKKEGDQWVIETNGGIFRSKFLIMATGPYAKPKAMECKGVETFTGSILHSSQYKTGKDFNGQKVLVVGFGNSACEIAIDLYEQGAKPSMSVRSPVNIIPRDILGVPVQELSILMSPLPPRLADIISRPLIKMTMGDLSKTGLKKMPYGPLEQIRRDAKAPVLDIGTLQLIRQGDIKVFGEIDFIDGSMVYFKNGQQENFDAIIAAIGYDPDYSILEDIDKSRFEDLKYSIANQKYFGKDGLYFCGYWISPTGQIREINSDAKKIARDISKRRRQPML